MVLVHADDLGPIDTGQPAEDGERFDIIVVGGGPGGAATAAYLTRQGRRVLLVEKGVWPRDKPCGDAVGGKSLMHVKDLGLKPTVDAGAHVRVTGIRFSSPKGHEVVVPLPEEEIEAREAGYTVTRARFDHLLFERATEIVREAEGRVMQGATCIGLVHDDGHGGEDPGPGSGLHRRAIGVHLHHDGADLTAHAPLIIGAGGLNCPVARDLVKHTHAEELVDRRHYCGAFREYWRGIEGLGHTDGELELHFVPEVKPGYFWIFPMADGIANVGLGMVLTALDKQPRKLKAMQRYLTQEHPRFRDRFANATLLEGTSTGWQLPFGSPRKRSPAGQPRRMWGNGVLLVGDAASLVDPFSGEGIGNALLSGRLVTDTLGGVDLADGLPPEVGPAYQALVWDRLGKELTNSWRLQRLTRQGWLLDRFVKKAARRPALQAVLTDMLASKEAQGHLHSRLFLAKALLF